MRLLSRSRANAALLTLMLLAGCARHKVAVLQLPPFHPVELAQIPEPEDPPIVEADEDEDDLPPVPVAEGAAVPKRQRRRVAKVPVTAPPAETPAVQAPTEVAAAGDPAAGATVIGELTPGGTEDPATQKEAGDLIAANEKRLGALSAETIKSQAALVGNVRNFQKQAQQALRSGDAGGAKTLATKAKLLLDDLDKATGS